LQIFLIVSTLVIYIVAAGLLSRGVWYLQAQAWNKIVGGDADEVGSGPGSYDIDQSVWHINVCHSVPPPLSLFTHLDLKFTHPCV
jgi:high-affinity iron transporter